MSRALPITDTLLDDDGTSHHYEVILLNPEDGFALISDVLEVAGEPLGSLLNSLKGDSEGGLGEGGAGLSSLLDGALDGQQIGRGLSDFARAIQAKGGPKLIRRILHNTMRDGKILSNQANFDAAYLGNYGEMLRAVIFTLKANFGKALRILGNPTSPAIAATRG